MIQEQKRQIPIVADVLVLLLTTMPIILFIPIALYTGLLTFEECKMFLFKPGLIIFYIFQILCGVGLEAFFRIATSMYDGTTESANKTNRFLKLFFSIAIIIPAVLSIVGGYLVDKTISNSGISPESFMGCSTMGLFVVYSLSLAFDFSLLLYVILDRVVEPNISYIPFEKHQIVMSLFKRNVFTVIFTVIGCLGLILTCVLLPANLAGGIGVIGVRILPIVLYTLFYISVVIISLVMDIQNVVKDIQIITGKLSEKDYSFEDLAPRHRSELGIIISDMNKVKKETALLLSSILNSTGTTVKQSDDLVSNMNLTQKNVKDILSAIESVKAEMENQSAGVQESNASVEQIMQNIRELNKSIENQAAGVTQSSAAVEEMVANIDSVSQILEKNNTVVNELSVASDNGQRTVKTAVHTAEAVLQQSAGILQASSMIQAIASRTNLLAMNAAIESAHAGEAGKGFAVVAEEIRKLAEQSSSQSKSIDDSLKGLSESISNITADIRQVETVFSTIYDLAMKVKTQETSIANAMEEQTSGNKQILDAMHSINDTTTSVKSGSTEMLTGGWQVVKEMRHLSEVTRKINDTMTQINESSSQISDAVAITTASTAQTQNSLSVVVKELKQFKI